MKYLVHVDVSRARGSQTWAIEAESEAHAKQLWVQGEGELLHEELEADDATIVDIEPAPVGAP